jgi:hypothetical protein
MLDCCHGGTLRYRPGDGEILAAIAELLETEVLDAVGPELRHNVRVGANLARILERQQSLEPAALEREREALSRLLGTSEDLEALRAELDRRLAAGDPSLDAGQVWAALVATARDDVAMSKPGYEAWAGG